MHAPGMAVSLSPASYALAGDSYFADLYHPTSPSIAAYSPSSDGFPWVLGSSGGAYSPPSQSPPVRCPLSPHSLSPHDNPI